MAASRGRAHTAKRALRRSDPAIAAQFGPDHYAALRAIARAGAVLRQDQSSSG